MAEIGICNAVIASLANAIPSQSQMITPAGGLVALLDPENRAGLEVVNPGKGNGMYSAQYKTITVGEDDVEIVRPTVKLRWYKPQVSDSGTERTCEGSPAPKATEIEFELTKYRQRIITVDWAYMRSLCDDASKIVSGGVNGGRFMIENTPIMNDIANRIMAEVRPLVRDINKDVLAVLNARFGTNIVTGNANQKDVTLFNADNSPSYDGIAELLNDFVINEMLGSPIIVGGGIWNKFFQVARWGGDSADGVNFGLMSKPKFYFDALADGASGFGSAGEALALAPSMAHFVQFERNKGMFGKRHANSEYGQFVINGLPEIKFDFKVVEVDCDNELYKFIISCDFDVFTAPDRFNTGDRAKGVNGLFHYRGVKAS